MYNYFEKKNEESDELKKGTEYIFGIDVLYHDHEKK